jgi:hypothetical protein
VNAPHQRFSNWKQAYEAVLGESDKFLLWTRIEVAEALMLVRLDDLDHNRDHRAERESILEALTALDLLKRRRLGFQKLIPNGMGPAAAPKRAE